MASSALPEGRAATEVVDRAGTRAGVPWYVWWGVVAVTSSSIGGAWDVSWHRSIGRDTFWTPAHMAIYACGVIAAVICGYLIFATTFGSSEKMRAASVNVFGLRAPLGAFIAAWGGVAMLTSAPFDNWWHAAYGLDVKIVSPPHTLLILGIRAVAVGILFLILAGMNRAVAEGTAEGDESFRSLRRLFLYLGGLMVGGQMFFLMEYTWDVKLHTVIAYIAMAIAVPIVLAVLSEASRYRWAATAAAAVYMLFVMGEILILPLFPAHPKLGPVYFPVTHLVPAKFPILMIVPALALDLLWQRTREWKPWMIAVVSGVVFTAVLVVVEWPFASFLLSKASENRFFGTIYFDYNSRPNGIDRLRVFFEPTYGRELAMGLLRAMLYGSIGTWVGLRFGRWMRSVQR
ncbi:hypothetical protein GCM10011507_22420 [Edaphobacter acidisoli]|uniref:Uncharacterized protein n=1 Tax=Edaphobacter acidisoli TaxID=2040573 RepID=A0A916W6K3_9BACT|nr:hypothetical protein [Edaphobacter acidisoli]GGA70397.1 hypothetical protein GCM10011507_22420 [Edaphobacter acidisoli]